MSRLSGGCRPEGSDVASGWPEQAAVQESTTATRNSAAMLSDTRTAKSFTDSCAW